MGIDLFLEKKDGQQFKFPVVPPEIEIAGGSGNQTIDTIKQGEVTVFGKRKLRQFSITSFFTANENAPFCRTKGAEYKEPIECVKALLEIQESEEPIKFVTIGLDLSAFWVTLENITWSYQPGTNDINYQVDFKEYRPFGQRVKVYEVTTDIFSNTKETKKLEGAGGRREPTGMAIGDRVLVSGTYYSSPRGIAVGAPAITDRPQDFLKSAWTKAQEEIYKAAKAEQKTLKAARAIIIDVVKTQTIAGIETKSAAPYCIADMDTKKRIGWVSENQIKHI